MRLAFFIAVLALAPRVAAAESLRAETCRRGEDERVIEVVAPGEIGAACDVVYRRAARLSVPYNANVDVNFCRARAAELAASLIAEGFSCSTGVSDDLEAALAGGPRQVATASAETDACGNVPCATAPSEAALLAPSNGRTAAVAANRLPEGDPLDVQLEKLDQPRQAAAAALEPAPDEPVRLAVDARPIEFRAPRPPKATGAGRLIAPAPSIDDIIDAAAAEPAFASADGLAARPTDEIIRALIAAGAAAWNEGSLEAYLGGYAQSADLMLISDSIVVTGWDAVKKSFEQEIAAYGGMGRLSVGPLEVRMTSDDVATVAGRYALTRPMSASTGMMTLVMKRMDGRWRIVQETRVADHQP